MANDAVKSGDYERAVQLFDRARTEAPTSTSASCGLAWAYIKLRRYAEASNAVAPVLAASPEHPRALSLVALAQMRSGLLRPAAENFVLAATKDPREPLAIAGLAEILLYTGRFAESLQYAEQAVRLQSDEPDYLFLLGQIAARAEHFEEAAEVYELFLKRAPKIDRERRARIKALIDCCRALVGLRLYAASGPGEASIPFEFSNGSLPIVAVFLNGKGPYRFAIDTGSGFAVITDSIASTLRMKPIAKGGSSQGVGGEGRFPLVYGLIRRFSVGPVTLENVPTYIRKSHQDASERIDGYIGLSILTRFLSAIDYPKKRLDLRPLDSQVAELGPDDVAVAYQVTGGSMLSVPTDVKTGSSLNFILDTGATTCVVATDVFDLYDLGTIYPAGASARVVGAAGVTEGVRTVVFPSLS